MAEAAQYTVDENGQWVLPGESVSFLIHLSPGYNLIGADYSSDYRITREENGTRLELLHVRYPVQVSLQLEKNVRTLRYEANGGISLAGDETAWETTVPVTIHPRPNTSQGIDLFRREGHTLTSWNTQADGGGQRIGLGSRVTVPEDGITLYAQWAQWTVASAFTWQETEHGVSITGYQGSADPLVIPAALDGKPVVSIAESAFRNVTAKEVILPDTLQAIEPGAFQHCALESLLLSDNFTSISDDAFQDCSDLQTLYINAAEAPYGYLWRRESVYADKVDQLILAQGRRKIVFYGGCSVWYNLDGEKAQASLGENYVILNLGLNGTVNSLVQMEILEHYLEEGDILFHTPELSSKEQLLLFTDMGENDNVLWCCLEYNYDLFSLVDIRAIHGVLDSLTAYLGEKASGGTYLQQYQDSEGRTYCDSTGSIPFQRTEPGSRLGDEVFLDPSLLADGLPALRARYDSLQSKGVQILVSFAAINLDAVPEAQQGNVQAVYQSFRQVLTDMDGPVLISNLWDYLYTSADFYDTNYHLLSSPASRNTDA